MVGIAVLTIVLSRATRNIERIKATTVPMRRMPFGYCVVSSGGGGLPASISLFPASVPFSLKVDFSVVMRESGRVSMGFSRSLMELAEVEGMPLSASRVLGASSMLGAV